MRRQTVDGLNEERRAHIRAILSNGGYLQAAEGPKIRQEEIAELNYQYDEIIDEIMNPGRAEAEDEEFRNNPLFAAGIRALDRAKWEFGGAAAAQSNLESQGL